jgi:glycosyltransferase involved in cell wall biosynthesis
MKSKALKKKIIILVDYFIPGFKAGGPIQSIQNFCLLLKDTFEISVITRDQDLGSTRPYPNIKSDEWNYNEDLKCNIFYCSEDKRKFEDIKYLIINQRYDYLYLNSLYSTVFTIPVLKLLYSNQIKGKIVLAPRGELNPGAKKIKRIKKSLYLRALKILGIPSKLTWHATNQMESKFISDTFGKKIEIKVASNIPQQSQKEWKEIIKEPGEVKLVTISRISKIKNIDFFLAQLANTEGNVTFDIVGPQEDNVYWSLCEEKINKLATNIKVRYLGEIENKDIPNLLKEYHFFISPTKGENFGHSIFEAMIGGKPVLISNKTPWVDLFEKRIGWDLSLDEFQKWKQVIEEMVSMPQDRYSEMSMSSWGFAKVYKQSTDIIKETKFLFE